MDQQNQQNSQYQGTSNAEQITNVSVPQSNDSTVSTATAPNTPPPPTQAGGQAQGPTPQALTGSPSPGTAANGPVGNPNPQQQPQPNMSLNKPNPKQAQTQAIQQAPMNPQQQAQVQKASVWHTIAETLAGGPRYAYGVDEYGNMTRQKVPVSTNHLALAVAMEALQGAATGLGVQSGPNAAGRAASAGFKAGQERVQNQDQASRQQATEDFKNRMQVTETNMRMYATARQIGKMDQEANEAYVAQYKSLADNLLKNYAGFVEGPVSYKDFAKYNVTKENAIPYQVVPRLDENGKQVYVNGIPQSDVNYLIIKPGLKATNLLNDSDISTLQKMKLLPEGSSADMILSTPMQIMQALNLKSRIAQWGTGQTVYGSYFDSVDKYNGGDIKPSDNIPSKTLNIANKQVDSIADQMASKYNVPPALVKGIILQESGGNPNVADSQGHTGGGTTGGAQGLMQLTSNIQKQYGVTDPHNVQQNIDAGVHYLSDILKNPKVNGNMKLAMAAYIGGLSSIGPDGKLDLSGKSAENKKAVNDYITGVSERLGLGMQQIADAAQNPNKANKGSVEGQLHPDTRLNLEQWNDRNPRTLGDNEKFMSILAHTNDNYSQAINQLSQTDNDAAANMIAFLGGPKGIEAHDQAVAIHKEQVQKRVAAEESEAENQVKLNQKQQQIQDNADRMSAVVRGPDGFKFDPSIANMSPEDASKALEDKGVTVPENFEDLYAIAKYDASPSDYTPKVWRTGDPNVMSKAQAVSYIRRFLNPDYKEADYKGVEKARVQLRDENSPVGKMLSSAGTALYHMQTLRDAAQAVGNGQLKLLNQIANDFGVATGDDAVTVYKAIIPKLADEVSKAAMAGGTPYQGQIEEGREALASSFSTQQVNRVLDGYMHLIHGRMVNQEGTARTTAKEHLPVPDQLTEQFKDAGLSTPWAEDISKPISSRESSAPNIPQGYDQMTKDGQWLHKIGGTWVQANTVNNNRATQFVNSQRGQ